VTKPLTLSNNIPYLQARPELIALLRARYRSYQAAKLTQGIFVALTIALPIAGVLLAPEFACVKPYLVLAALALLLVDVGLIDRMQKDRMKRGAKLQEEFDTQVLSLPWNRFVAGMKVDHEDVRAASATPLPPERESGLVGWYDPCVGEVPLHFGRLVCQRTNISYDTRLRKKYGSGLLYACLGLGVALAFIGLALKLTFEELLLTLAVPFTPLFTWALREHRKQMDTTSSLTTLKSEFEKLWDKAITGGSLGDFEKEARELQDAIYQHRTSSPLVFDWVYDRMRSTNEDEAQHAAQKLVQQAKAALQKDSA
jgi:SMODS-associating 4TM effector domain